MEPLDFFSFIKTYGIWIAVGAVILFILLEEFARDFYRFLKRMWQGLFFRSREENPSPLEIELKPIQPEIEQKLIQPEIEQKPAKSEIKRTPPKPEIERKPTVTEIQTPIGHIRDLQALADGEETRLFSGKLEKQGGNVMQPVVLKLPISKEAAERLRQEESTLNSLHSQAEQYGKHLPRILGHFRMKDHRFALVLEKLDGLNLVQLRERFPLGIEPRHVIWIFRRTLSVLGYVHSQGVLHGNITPEHILVRPKDHNVWLLDWTRSINPRVSGQQFRLIHPIYGPPEAKRKQPALPASDLYALALCMIYALGGEPGDRNPPTGTPEPLARLIQALLRESPLQRPRDAWALYNQLEGIRDTLFGPHRFVEFIVDT